MKEKSEQDGWTCRHCGSTDPHHEIQVGEINIDVTCQSVYLLPEGGSSGLAFDHEEFAEIVDHFESRNG